MSKFELISKYEGKDSLVNLYPRRKTSKSAGYDFFVAEDTIIPPYTDLQDELTNLVVETISNADTYKDDEAIEKKINYGFLLDEIAAFTKASKCKPTLVPTGVKCKLDDGKYLELSVRSSCPLKYWLILANGVGIIDGDYYNNPDNEGHIYFQMINLSKLPIRLRAGDCVGQGIIKSYGLTEDDTAEGDRVGGFGSTDA